jgi:glucoamylase
MGAKCIVSLVMLLGAANTPPIANDGPGAHAIWTTGNKVAVGTAATPESKVWFTVAQGVTTEVFYPRLDIPNVQDMQYLVSDGATFADFERDATDHVVQMADEKALEHTIVNTDRRSPPRYRLTNTYISDPGRDTLLIRTRFESLDGGRYGLYVIMNPSMAGGGLNDQAWWDDAHGALMASGTEALFGETMTIISALKIAAPNAFSAHSNGYIGAASDCTRNLRAHFGLVQQLDRTANNGNVIQCGQVGGIGTGATTFTVALGYGHDAESALAAAEGSLATGFAALEARYRSGWHEYINTPPVKPAPASVTKDTQRRRVYNVALMTLHAAEDKTFPGASIAAFATPWGDFQNGDALNDGYHRVWGRDLYHQATGLLAAGDRAQALRMVRFLWDRQFIAKPTPGEATTYPPGAFPRYSPVSGIDGASRLQLGCCEQLDQNGFAILLAWMLGLTDPATYEKIRTAAQHMQSAGPATIERWEEMDGKSPSSMAAEIAGLIAAADIARQNGDTKNALAWESTADAWLANLPAWTFTTTGAWGGFPDQGVYFERLDKSASPNDGATITLANGTFPERSVVDFGFLELVRLGVLTPDDWMVTRSLLPTSQAFDTNSAMQVHLPSGIYFRRYVHDYYGESNADCSGWPAQAPQRYGRPWPLLSGERGEYELANHRSADESLQAMANAANDGYFLPEQIWDRADLPCFGLGRPTGGAAPLTWASGQYLRLAQAITAHQNLETLSVVRARYGGARPIVGARDRCLDAKRNTVVLARCTGSSNQAWSWNANTGALQALGQCLVPTADGADGAVVMLDPCDGSPSQEWRWRRQDRLVHQASGRCLHAGGARAQLRIRTCEDHDSSQAWTLRP